MRFWKFKFKKWNFGNLFENGILKKNEFGNCNFWKNNLKIEVTKNPEFLKVYLKKKIGENVWA